jgi:hypothetical protein
VSEPVIRRMTPDMIRGEIDRIRRERREALSGMDAARTETQRLEKIEQLQYEAERHLLSAQACFDAIGLLK